MSDLIDQLEGRRETLDVPLKPTPTRKRKSRLRFVSGVLAVLAVTGVLVLRNRSSTQPARPNAGAAPPPVMVSTVAAQRGEIGSFVNALGVVTPLNTVSVKSRVDGELVSVNYQEGQMVHAGDPLVEIDPAPFQAALVQAEGQLPTRSSTSTTPVSARR